MRETGKVGRFGEDLAESHYLSKGFVILARNWRWGRAEIDLIAGKEDLIVFVEVKTRKNADFGLPELMLAAAQKRRILNAAEAFLANLRPGLESRMDVVAVLLDADVPKLHVVEAAFIPNWMEGPARSFQS